MPRSLKQTASDQINIPTWQLVILLLISFSGFWIGYAISKNINSDWSKLIPEIVHYFLFVFLLWIFFHVKKISFIRILQHEKTTETNYIKLLIYSLFLSLFTTGIYLTIYWPLTIFAPGFLEYWVLGDQNIFIFSSQIKTFVNISVLPSLLAIILLIVVAPIVEEFFFRGLLFQSIAVKFNTLTGIILSSICFAILHGDFFGSFVFAVFLCWLYQRTNSIIAPIVCHMFNNLVVVLYQIWILSSSDFSIPVMDVEKYKAGLQMGVILLVITSYWAYKTTRICLGSKNIPYLKLE